MAEEQNIDPEQTFSIPEEEEMVTIVHDGLVYENQTKSSLASIVPAKNINQVWAEGLAAKSAIENRNKVRAAITKNVGDTEAILGTTADVTQLNAAAVLALIAAFKTGDTFPKFRTAFMGTIEALVPSTEGGDDVYVQAQQFLGGVQSGDIILTAALKGLPEVIGEMAGRSTGVATILAQAKAGAK